MLTIKMISVDGAFKALVLDMSQNEGNRLVRLFEGLDHDLVENEAQAFVACFKAVVWH